MSYTFTVNGHSPSPHNPKVKEVFDAVILELRKIEGNVNGGGHSVDSSGQLNFDDTTVYDPNAVVEESAETAEALSATPGALEHAETTGVDLNTVTGTGTDGKITKKDVADAAKS